MPLWFLISMFFWFHMRITSEVLNTMMPRKRDQTYASVCFMAVPGDAIVQLHLGTISSLNKSSQLCEEKSPASFWTYSIPRDSDSKGLR